MNPPSDQPPPASAPGGSAPPPPPERAEDVSSQALSDALRSSFVIIKILMIGLVVVFLGSGFFTVGPQEKALILRFGKPIGEDESALLGPGPHWAFPYPIDEVVRIPVGEVQTVNTTIGWYETSPALEAAGREPEPRQTLAPGRDGYALTGDGNIVHVRGALRYRITEPGLAYKLELAEAPAQVQNAFDNALLFAAARSTVEITRDTTAFREEALQRLRDLIAAQRLGIEVDQMTVQVIPPRQLKADFARVLEAEVRRNTGLSDARKYENETLNRAQAEARARVNTAEAERKGRVEQVASDARRFTELLPEYRKNPQLFMDLLYADALARVYTNASEKFIVQERPDGQPRAVRLLLSREPPRPRPVEPPKGHADEH
jgi:membrane protease subunit HflK